MYNQSNEVTFLSVDLQLPTDNFHVFVAQFLINLRETYRTSQLAIDNVTIGLKDTLRLFGTMFLVKK